MSGARPLRVLHVGKFYPPEPGGIESHLATLCGGLVRAGVEVEALVAARGRRTVTEMVDGVRVTRLGTALTAASASFTPGLAARIRRTGADVVHVQLPNPPAVLSFLASRWRGPLVASYHSDVVRQRVLGAALNPLLHAFLRRADAILASSPEYLASSPVLARHAARTVVIPLGIDSASAAEVDPAAVERLRREWGPRMVLGVGRLVYYKGFRYLLRAMEAVDGQLVIVGDGPLRGELEAEARAAGVADRVHFAGKVPDPRPYFAAADVFVLPAVARSEAFGLVQLEAMACGTPVVNTWLDTGVPFASVDGETGLTVPPADAGALAAAIRRLLDDDALRARLGAAARVRVETRFSVARMTADVLALYRRLVAAPSRPGR